MEVQKAFLLKIPSHARQALSQHLLSASIHLVHTPQRLPQTASIPGTSESKAYLSSDHPSPLPPPFQSRSRGLLPSPPFLIAHPQGRQPHQLFPAAGAPIGGRPAAPNINDTQEPGLEAQARAQSPTTTALTTSKEQFSILSGASGSRREAETGCPAQPLVLLSPL